MQPDPIFLDEARDNLDAMEQSLLAICGGGDEPDLIQAMFRCAHSVKGGAAAFGLTELAELMHQAESLLDLWRRNRLRPDAASKGLLLEAVAMARRYLVDGSQPKPMLITIARQLQGMLGSDLSGPHERLVQVVLDPNGRPDIANIVPDLFRDIVGLGTVVNEAPGPGGRLVYTVSTDTPDAELLDLLAMHGDRDQFVIDAAPGVLPAGQDDANHVGKSADTTSARVLVGEMDAISRISMTLDELAARLSSNEPQSQTALATDIALTCEKIAQLRKAIQSLRTAPMALIFDPVPKLLQGLSVQLSKEFKLEISGEVVRVNRFMAQGLANLVIHMVRNACDHGIESPAERTAAGKPRAGLIGLDATVREGMVRIAVHDDGRGLSRERLLMAARASGLDVSDEMSDEEVRQLVFVPGFTTAVAVSRVSGRGVGMELVRRKVAEFGGQVLIESSHGVGTRVTIALPIAS